MARKKEPAKPLLAVKFEFVESLDAVCQAALNLSQAIDLHFVLADREGYQIPAAVKEQIEKANTAFKAAFFTNH